MPINVYKRLRSFHLPHSFLILNFNFWNLPSTLQNYCLHDANFLHCHSCFALRYCCVRAKCRHRCACGSIQRHTWPKHYRPGQRACKFLCLAFIPSRTLQPKVQPMLTLFFAVGLPFAIHWSCSRDRHDELHNLIMPNARRGTWKRDIQGRVHTHPSGYNQSTELQCHGSRASDCWASSSQRLTLQPYRGTSTSPFQYSLRVLIHIKQAGPAPNLDVENITLIVAWDTLYGW